MTARAPSFRYALDSKPGETEEKKRRKGGSNSQKRIAFSQGIFYLCGQRPRLGLASPRKRADMNQKQPADRAADANREGALVPVALRLIERRVSLVVLAGIVHVLVRVAVSVPVHETSGLPHY